MRFSIAPLIAALAIAAATHAAILFSAPFVATDLVIGRIDKARGLTPNQIAVAPPAAPPRDAVPMGNPDTLVASSWLDLGDGPLVFEAPLPEHAEYWSVSIFAHDSDTDFVLSDRDLQGASHARVEIYGPGHNAPATSADRKDVAHVSTRRAFLLVRAIMRDRNDEASVAALNAEMSQASLEPLR